MNDTYTRLCGHDRKVIANMAQAGNNQKAIAKAIGRSQGTVSKELRRNRGQRGYRPLQADRLARERQAAKRSRPKVIVGEHKEEVEARLRSKHSPEQIGNALALRGLGVCHESIYQHVARDKEAGGDLACNLRINGKRRYRWRNKIGRREKIPIHHKTHIRSGAL